MADRVLVRKLRPDGSEAFRWTGRVMERDETSVVIVARFNGPPGDLGYMTLEQSDLFVEFYSFDRWYNVFQVYSQAGDLKGWYCNVGTPALLEDGEMRYTDLILDVFVAPDGRYQLLDQEAFEAHRPSLNTELAQGAERGLHELVDLAEQGQLPGRPFADALEAMRHE